MESNDVKGSEDMSDSTGADPEKNLTDATRWININWYEFGVVAFCAREMVMADSRIFIVCKIDFETATVPPELPDLSSQNCPKNCTKQFRRVSKYGGMSPKRAPTAQQLECGKPRPKNETN